MFPECALKVPGGKFCGYTEFCGGYTTFAWQQYQILHIIMSLPTCAEVELGCDNNIQHPMNVISYNTDLDESLSSE